MRHLLISAIWTLLAMHASRADERPLLKAGYLPISAKIGIASKMREAGLNAVWPKITSFSPNSEDERVLPRLETWCETCAANELELWPVINFAGGANELDFFPGFRREVTTAGITMPHTPCPVDEDYWRKVVFSRCMKLAEWSRTRPSLRGVVLDLEMYGADHAGYSAACACEVCRRGAGSADAKALIAWQRREVERIGRELERAVHRIAPKFQFAAMHLEESFAFHEGLALGLGTPDVPVIVAAERTYAAGYTNEVDETRERFRKQKAHVRYLGGLSLTHFSAEQIAPQLYALGSHGDGFWLYTLASLAAPNEQVPEALRVFDPQEQYWPGFRAASDELEKFATSRGQHVSPLVAKLETPDLRATVSKRVLEPVASKHPKLPLAGDETRLRRSNIQFVQLAAGEVLRMRATAVRTSKQTSDGKLTVLDPDSKEILSRTISVGATESIELTAKSAGTYWLMTSIGQNACELIVSNAHLVYFAGRHQRLRFYGHVRPLFFIVGEGQQAALDVLVESPGDSVRVRLRNPQGQVAAESVMTGSQAITADGPAGVWSLTIETAHGGSFAGVQLGLVPPLAPYLADAPERLLRDKK